MEIHSKIVLFLSILIINLNHAKSYKSKQVENGRVLYVFALGSRELIDCPIYSPGRRSSQKLKWLHNGESLVLDSSIKQQINGTLEIRMLEKHQGTYQCIDENGGEFTSEKEGF